MACLTLLSPTPAFYSSMIVVNEPPLFYKIIMWIVLKVRGSTHVAMVDPFTLNIMAYPAPYAITEKTYQHELVHIEQIRQEGRVKFLFKYLFYLIRYGYDNNPYEIEAKNF